MDRSSISAATTAKRVILRNIEALTSFSEDVKASGLEPGSKLISLRKVKTPSIARPLKQKETLRFRRLRTANSTPVCIETTYLPNRGSFRFKPDDLEGSLYRELEARGKSIFTSKELIQVRNPTPGERLLLRLSTHTPVVEIRRLAFTKSGTPMEFSISVLRADRYALYVELHRAPNTNTKKASDKR